MELAGVSGEQDVVGVFGGAGAVGDSTYRSQADDSCPSRDAARDAKGGCWASKYVLGEYTLEQVSLTMEGYGSGRLQYYYYK